LVVHTRRLSPPFGHTTLIFTLALILFGWAVLAQPARANVTAERLLRQDFDKVNKAKTVCVDYTFWMADDDIIGPSVWRLKWKSPGHYRSEFWPLAPVSSQFDPEMPHVINGRDASGLVYQWLADGTHSTSHGKGPGDPASDFGILQFLIPNSSDQGDYLREARLHALVFNGYWRREPYRIVRISENMPPGTDYSGSTDIYIGSDHLVHRICIYDNKRIIFDCATLRVNINPSITNADVADSVSPNVASWPEIWANRDTPIDPATRALLHAVMVQLKSLKSLSAQIDKNSSWTFDSGSAGTEHISTEVQLLRPHYWRQTSLCKRTPVFKTDITANFDSCDGQRRWRMQTINGDTTYLGSPFIDAYLDNAPDFSHVFAGFFDHLNSTFYLRDGLTEMHYGGKTVWNGEQYDLIVGTRPVFRSSVDSTGTREVGPSGIHETVYIGADHLIHRLIVISQSDEGYKRTDDTEITNITVDPPLTPADFTFTTPDGAKDMSAEPLKAGVSR
jgi:hypothetical protein